MNKFRVWIQFVLLIVSFFSLHAGVEPGVDVLFKNHCELLQGHRIGLLTTQIMLDAQAIPTYQRFKKESSRCKFKLISLFAPEHGFWAGLPAEEKIVQEHDEKGLIIHTLYGDLRRPSKSQLNEIDLMVVDLQDVGIRTYTYVSTLFYVMEACASAHVPVLVLDRPNPINGVVVDGPCLDKALRSFVGYIDVAFCHGMTIGELASYFNEQYAVGCNLTVIKMHGWKRSMTYRETQLAWLGTSPQIPDADTPLYYGMTNVLGNINWFSCGGGYSQPFRLIGHPDGKPIPMVEVLQNYHFEGIRFYPVYFKSFAGAYQKKVCKGVRLLVVDHLKYRPFQIQMALFETLKKLYPKSYHTRLKQLSKGQVQLLEQYFGIKGIIEILDGAPNIWSAIEKKQGKQMAEFKVKRARYLSPEYE